MLSSCQQSYPIKLTGGSNVYEGQIEVLFCRSGSRCEWRTVCASGWTDTEAVVVCRQLGLYDSHIGKLKIYNSYCSFNIILKSLILIAVPTNYSNSGHNGSIAMSVRCSSSNFSSLWDCTVAPTLCASSRATVIIRCCKV